jgi:serine/threonine protein kinase
VNQKEPFRASTQGLPAGTRLNGIYEIDQMIGAGGMGEIYRSHEIQTGAAIAIKMLLPDVAENETALALFRREAAALHNLPHDAIVRYFLFTVEPVLLRPYLAMEFVDGRSLSDMLQDGPLPFDAIVKLLRRVASGLQAAHDRGIIHRDVSPDNIIIPHGDVTKAKIIDFGIARSTQLEDPTIIGSGFAGKQNYVSPEQVGLFGGEVTPKSDIYSLGLVLYQAFTGHKLDMGGSQFQLVEKRRSVPDLAAVDPRVRSLLARMLQPDPGHRPASMEEIVNWSFPAPDQPSGKHGTAVRSAISSRASGEARAGRSRLPVIISAIVVLVAAGGLGFYNFYWSTPDQPIRPPPPPLVPSRPSLDAPAVTRPNSLALSPPVAPAPPPEAPATVPPMPPAVDTSRIDRIRGYIERYDGGNCFFILPIAVSQNAAVMEAFAASTANFEAFSDAFKRELGFSPAVGAREVSQAQCAAIRFLRQSRGERARTPRISLTATDVRSGDVLNGNIENIANQNIELLLVSESGQVQNLTSLTKPGTDSLSFSIGMQRNDGPTSAPQLLMVVATPRAIDALKPSQLPGAERLFPQVMSEALGGGLTMATAARYFRLGK